MIQNPDLPTNGSRSPMVQTESPALSYLQFASILHKGLEKTAEIQKYTLDMYAQQSRSTVDATKQVFPMAPAPLFELAELAIREFLNVQVKILDLMLRQSAAYMETLRAHSGSEYDGGMAKLMSDTADCYMAMNKKAVDFITQQNQTLADDVRRQVDGNAASNSNAAEAIQRGTEAIIQTQKRFWDVVLKPFEIWRVEAPETARTQSYLH
jgi:hypothetical protein